MMPQTEGSSARQQLADPAYGRYEGNHTSSARQPYETSYAQEVREGPSGKVYPLLRDRTNLLCFALAVIALGLLVLFGLVFGLVVGGMAGTADFFFACITLLIIAGVGIIAIKKN